MNRTAIFPQNHHSSDSVTPATKHNHASREERVVGHDAVLTSSQIFDADVEDWRQLAGPIRARFRTDEFGQGLAFVNAIGEAAELSNHAPDITLTKTGVTVTVSSHDVGGVTDRDITLARKISTIAAEAGLTADTASLMQAEFALDTNSSDRVSDFYAALLGGQPAGVHAGGDLVDPTGQMNTLLWWQRPRDDSQFPLPESAVPQSWHLDVWVSHDEAEGRIAAALAAGGHLVSDTAAPSYWVLEDPDGNRACICAPMVH
ncbi:4a-hydroxytetrahydrobiopterin dehydratase [Brevibacterium aurantiacum]|uniref:Putative pterin-4-alpha-carbinolamine dehydratase n=1 Tax=Brevibacterium aurantiacum TaxID=273384 RepID=A0A556CC46_BREAU|nr:4a-hydroxytetrahydrobiopterin dehydratase [Brevibacterium aurantiacum]TSI15017.1 4a-hydroxytetrahydrobiopterin dehydratase [Brevibacterium aurantiacum]